MPLYDFECKDCGYKFEKLIFKEEEIKDIKCPKCNSSNVKKLLTSFGINMSGESSSSSCNCSTGSCCPTCGL